MQRRDVCLALAAVSSLATVPAPAQSTRTARVAWVAIESANRESPFYLSFGKGMRTLGWVEGRNLVIETWWGDGSAERLKKLVPEIVASRPDVIVAVGGPSVRPLIDLNVQLPVIFIFSADVVLAKVVDSWARPGGNRTGISLFSLELVPKRLQLMKELLPGMKRVAIVGWPPHAGEHLELEAASTAATKLDLAHQYYGAHTAAELDLAFEKITQWKADAMLVLAGGLAAAQGRRFAAFALRSRIPAVSAWADFAEQGNLMTYGPVLRESVERLASFVDRVLHGAKPADMPVELPTKFEMVINMKTAKTLGVPIPHAVLLRADRVIE